MDRDEQRALSRQLRCPTGIEGVAVSEAMTHLNARMNQVAFEHLDAGPADRVLEIGFGPGSLIDQLLLKSSYVAGLDLSPTMVVETRRRFGARAKACCGNALAIPIKANAFTRICTVNTVYFWEDLRQVFLECRRVLCSEGGLVVCFNAGYELEKDSWDLFGFTPYREDEVIVALRSAGFTDIDCRMDRDPEQGEFFCLRAF
jgi:SAM-dependent methyltransferase